MVEQQKEFKLKQDDFSKEKLELSGIAEKITKSELFSLHEQILRGDGEKGIDILKVKSYLESIQKKTERKDIKNEGGAWSFAIQLFLKSQGLYTDGKIDGIFGPKTKSAVMEFQRKNGFVGDKVDGYAGKDTIQKMIEVLNQNPIEPEINTENKIPILNVEKKEDKPFDGVAYTWNESDFEKYLEKEYGKTNYTNFYTKSLWNNFEKGLISNPEKKEKLSKDVYFNTFSLYKSMKPLAGKNKDFVNWIFENYEGDFKLLVNLFGKPGGKDVFQWLDSTYSDKNKIIELLTKQFEKAEKNKFVDDVTFLKEQINNLKNPIDNPENVISQNVVESGNKQSVIENNEEKTLIEKTLSDLKINGVKKEKKDLYGNASYNFFMYDNILCRREKALGSHDITVYAVSQDGNKAWINPDFSRQTKTSDGTILMKKTIESKYNVLVNELDKK